MGDDAGLIDHGAYFTAITTDLLVEGVHFDLSYMPLKHGLQERCSKPE